MGEKIIPFCIGCNKPASEIQEYIEAAKDCEMSVEEYVREEEGTYNPENGHFLCTDCYINAGMPSRKYPNGWLAP